MITVTTPFFLNNTTSRRNTTQLRSYILSSLDFVINQDWNFLIISDRALAIAFSATVKSKASHDFFSYFGQWNINVSIFISDINQETPISSLLSTTTTISPKSERVLLLLIWCLGFDIFFQGYWKSLLKSHRNSTSTYPLRVHSFVWCL